MIQLKTGPYLALDASFSGDSYFVKIKLKSISHVPVSAAPRGWGGRWHWSPHRPEGTASRQWPPGWAAAVGRLEGLVWEEGKGWKTGLLSEALNQNRSHQGWHHRRSQAGGSSGLGRGASLLLCTRGFLNGLASDSRVVSVTV